MFDCGVNLFSDRLDPIETLAQSSQAGLSGLLIICSTLEESIEAQAFCHQHASVDFTLRFTAGVHPHNASSWTSKHYRALRDITQDRHCAAIGECGLDFNRNFSSPEQQEFAFIQQLKLAQETGLGLYLHERDAWEKQLSLLDEYAHNSRFKIVHCFTGGKHQLDSYLRRGCHIGITGWVCDAKRGKELRAAVADIPLEKLLVETDAPFLFPKTVRPRSSNNQPRYLPYIIEEIAELIDADADNIKRITEKNALALFGNYEGHPQDS